MLTFLYIVMIISLLGSFFAIVLDCVLWHRARKASRMRYRPVAGVGSYTPSSLKGERSGEAYRRFNRALPNRAIVRRNDG